MHRSSAAGAQPDAHAGYLNIDQADQNAAQHAEAQVDVIHQFGRNQGITDLTALATDNQVNVLTASQITVTNT